MLARWAVGGTYYLSDLAYLLYLIAVRWRRIKDVLICRNCESWWIRDGGRTLIHVKVDTLATYRTHVLLLYSHWLWNRVVIRGNTEISVEFLLFTLVCCVQNEGRLVVGSHVLLLMQVGLLKLEVKIAHSRVVSPHTHTAFRVAYHRLVLLMLLSQTHSLWPRWHRGALQRLLLLLLPRFDFLILVLQCCDCGLHLLNLLCVLDWDALPTGCFWVHDDARVVFGLGNILPM